MFGLEYGTDGFWNLACSIYFVGSVLLFGLLFWFRYHDKKSSRVESENNVAVQTGEIREVYVSGYAVKVRYQDGIWYSPFTNVAGYNFNSSSIDSLRHSIKTCIKKPERFLTQYNELIDIGIITKLESRKVISITRNQETERRAS